MKRKVVALLCGLLMALCLSACQSGITRDENGNINIKIDDGDIEKMKDGAKDIFEKGKDILEDEKVQDALKKAGEAMKDTGKNSEPDK